MKFTVQITETLQRVIEVEASSAEEAEMIVRRRYYSGDPILDASDHVETKIESVERLNCQCASVRSDGV